jgi:hypothetical protein
MRKIIFALFLGGAVNALVFPAALEGEWFISNRSGMLVTKTQKTRALHSEYAVQVQQLRPENVPREISKYYSVPWKIECRILYENARRTRTQWTYKDLDKSTLFIASIGEDGAGFLEWYNERGSVIEEQRLNADGSGLFISYSYKDMFLLKAEAHSVEAVIKPQVEKTGEAEVAPEAPRAPENMPENAPEEELLAGIDALTEELITESDAGDDTEGTAPVILAENVPVKTEPPPESVAKFVRNPEGPAVIPAFYIAVTGREAGPLWTDNYRYTRTNMIRAIERNYAAAARSDEKSKRLSFPRFVLDSKADKEFVSPGNSLASAFLLDALSGANRDAAQVSYSLDTKQRILSEVRRDEEGEVTGELTNIWKNDRIEQITWKAKDDERIIQFNYNRNGDRIGEKDYRNGVLERTVEPGEGDEIETLYINDKPVLRAIWRDGIKIVEERISNIQTR